MQVSKQNKKILHITPHLGGGVGSVLMNYFSTVKEGSSFTHTIVCLDYANKNAIASFRKFGFPIFDNMSKKKIEILNLISNFDEVIIHWWNHPLLYDFLVREKLPPCRLILWSHTAGFYPPSVFTKKILEYPDIFVFTTPASLKAPDVKTLSNKRKESLRVVWSTSGVKHTKSIQPKKHDGFNVGYIGTVDYAKIHPRFLIMCNKINIPGIKFIVCGGSGEDQMRREAEKLGIEKKFNFTGIVSDITEYLSLFDVFGYPLASYHYGTCDQVLAEAMAAGIVPVVLQNHMEKLMIQNGKTGIIAKNEDEYVRAIESLYKDKKLRDNLSKNAREYAIKTFSLDMMVEKLDIIFKEILEIPKTHKKWTINKKGHLFPKDIFLEALGNHGKDFISYCEAQSATEKTKATRKISRLGKKAVWRSMTKGTVHHYFYFFPDDKNLSIWSKLMKKLE